MAGGKHLSVYQESIDEGESRAGISLPIFSDDDILISVGGERMSHREKALARI